MTNKTKRKLIARLFGPLYFLSYGISFLAIIIAFGAYKAWIDMMTLYSEETKND